MAHQHGSHAVVTAQQVATADHEHLAARRLEIDDPPGVRFIGRQDHTIPLITNFDISFPVLPS